MHYNIRMKLFGERLKALREEQGLTQKSLAEKLFVSIPTLSHWECGYQEPSFKDLVLICDFFEVEADYLLGRLDEFGNVTRQADITPQERSILDGIRELPDRERAQAVEFIKYLASKRS